MSAYEELLAQARRHMWAAWRLSGEELASQAAVTLMGLGMLVPESGAQELERLRARLDEVHRLPQDTLTPAEVRLAQYGERTKTWSTATYDSGTERALHGIACALRDTLAEVRDQRTAARLRVAELEAERHTTNEALDDAVQALREAQARLAEYERPADEDPIAYTLTEKAAPDFFQPGHTYQRRRWLFQCLAIAPAPHDGEVRAVGYLARPGETATVHGMGREQWENDGWADATAPGPDAEAGAR